MKGRVIAVAAGEDHGRLAALIVDGRLEDLVSDPLRGETGAPAGAICHARVERLAPKLGGAFVALAPDQQGFLRETKGLREGDTLLVQVSAHPEPRKAVPVTRRVLLKGHVAIYVPGAPGINLSRQIRDGDTRKRLADEAEAACRALGTRWDPACDGLIIRSAAETAPEGWLARDIGQLLDAWDDIGRTTERTGAPAIVGGWQPTMATMIEWCTVLPDRIVHPPSGPGGDFMRDAGYVLSNPGLTLAHVQSDPDPFDHFGVWDEIERLKSPDVALPSGGTMAIEATRAMVTVDVNTAGQFDAGAPMTANIEAARELPRQLRLRGLGGQIAIDFAPLKKMHRKKIEETLKAAFRRDPVETTLAGWTPLGNFELTRKRERRPLTELLP